MRLLLIQPPTHLLSKTSPPLGLAYLSAIAESKGWRAKIAVSSAINRSIAVKELLKESALFAPDIIGISINTLFCKISYDLINKLSFLNSVIIAGGPHATILPEEVLTHSLCSIVVRGEGEETFSELLDLFLRKEKDLSKIKGISFKDEKGNIRHNPERNLISEEKLNKLPFPAKHLFLKKHFSILGSISASRGCPFSCIFCSQSIFKKMHRRRTTENVFQEIKELYNNYGVRHLQFVDDIFTIDEFWVRDLCKRIMASKLSVTWHCFSRVDCVTDGLLQDMKKAGCLYVIYGVETISPHSLELIKKNISLDNVKKVLEMSKKEGLGTLLSLIYGFPWETSEDIEKITKFIKEIYHLTYFINLNLIVPFPGTELYIEYNERYNFKEWWLNESIFKNMHLYQHLRSCYPDANHSFFPLSGKTRAQIHKAYSIVDERMILSQYMIKKVKGKYAVFDEDESVKSPYFAIFRLIKLFFIRLSNIIARFCPELELKFLLPTYITIRNLKISVEKNYFES